MRVLEEKLAEGSGGRGSICKKKLERGQKCGKKSN
jgi:hypothetical protein